MLHELVLEDHGLVMTLFKAVGTVGRSNWIELVDMMTLAGVENPGSGCHIHSQESMGAGKVFSMS